MASTKEYLEYVLDQLSGAEQITSRAMMGEYVLYCRGKVIGGVYDDRLLLKPTPGALRLMRAEGLTPVMEIPYEGAKELLLADVDRRELLCRMAQTITEELPETKKKARKQG